ncbi:hypothetical protein LguiA_023524 [Lonicera macranthoides]
MHEHVYIQPAAPCRGLSSSNPCQQMREAKPCKEFDRRMRFCEWIQWSSGLAWAEGTSGRHAELPTSEVAKTAKPRLTWTRNGTCGLTRGKYMRKIIPNHMDLSRILLTSTTRQQTRSSIMVRCSRRVPYALAKTPWYMGSTPLGTTNSDNNFSFKDCSDDDESSVSSDDEEYPSSKISTKVVELITMGRSGSLFQIDTFRWVA